jgi:hypothetical protein
MGFTRVHAELRVTLSIWAMEPLAMIEAENPRSISPAGPAYAVCESAPLVGLGRGVTMSANPPRRSAGEESGAAHRREEDPFSPRQPKK